MNSTAGLLTLVQCGDRAAATLHLMLSDADQAHLEASP